MTRIPYTFRRSGIYYWRRRIPGQFSSIVFSLGVSDPRSARRLSLFLAGVSETILAKVGFGFAQVTPQEAKTFLQTIFLKHRAKIELTERMGAQNGAAWQEEEWVTRAAAIAFNLLAERGENASLTEEEAAELKAGPDGPALLKQVLASLDTYRRMHWSEGAMGKLRMQLGECLGREEISAVELTEARRLKLKAFAMASGAVAHKRKSPLDLDALADEIGVVLPTEPAAAFPANGGVDSADSGPAWSPAAEATASGEPNLIDLAQNTSSTVRSMIG